MPENSDHAIILGAGFSKCAGLPLASELSGSLLNANTFKDDLDNTITDAITEFLNIAFYWRSRDPIPSLEDIFTMIDLSANSGHNLGRKFTPKLLRAIRRMLIYRVFQVLDQDYQQSSSIQKFLDSHLQKGGTHLKHFIVMNWDIVLERHLEQYDHIGVNYCIDAFPWDGTSEPTIPTVDIVKVHGSSNWVYCDNCKSVFFDKSRKLSLAIKAGLVKADLRLFNESFNGQQYKTQIGVPSKERACRKCTCAVGPHIATFSYRKSFRTHAFARSWQAAEKILANAKKWIFIGYSLPSADYEFKHLLKTAHLMFAKGKKSIKEIDVILLRDTAAEHNFKTFFGRESVKIHQAGLQQYTG